MPCTRWAVTAQLIPIAPPCHIAQIMDQHAFRLIHLCVSSCLVHLHDTNTHIIFSPFHLQRHVSDIDAKAVNVSVSHFACFANKISHTIDKLHFGCVIHYTFHHQLTPHLQQQGQSHHCTQHFPLLLFLHRCYFSWYYCQDVLCCTFVHQQHHQRVVICAPR